MQTVTPGGSPAAEGSEPTPEHGSRPERVRWGRERGPGAPGDRLAPRLGPPSPELEPFHNRLPLLDPRDGDLGATPHQITPDLALAEAQFVALDCETTGHFPHRMVELGAVRFQLGAVADGQAPRQFLESLVHTTDHINPYARRVHGISRSMLTGAPPLHRVALTFHHFARGAIPVEHSADAFDTRLVAKALDRPPPKYHLDTSRIAGSLFGLRDTIGLEKLCDRLGVTHRQPHFALADAEATAECLVELVQIGIRERGWSTLGDVLAVGMPPEPRPLERTRVHAREGSDAAPVEPGGPTRRRRHRGGRRRRGAPAVTPSADPGA